MEDIISKELLSEVLGFKIEDFLVEKNKVEYCYLTVPAMYERADSINIYELAFKNCVEWAFKNHYTLCMDKNCCELWRDNIQEYITSSDSKIYEGVFKSCQWILDNRVD